MTRLLTLGHGTASVEELVALRTPPFWAALDRLLAEAAAPTASCSPTTWGRPRRCPRPRTWSGPAAWP